MYTEEDLKSISDFLRLTAQEALKVEPPNQKDFESLMKLVRQLEAIRFNPILFESILEEYEVNYSLMEEPLENVPLHINDAGIISKTLIRWRCTNSI